MTGIAPGARIPAAWWRAYAALALVHLALQVLAPSSPGTRLTQVCLAPLLLVMLARATATTRSRVQRWTLAALTFCFLGDLLPGVVPADIAFLAMVGAFLVAQVCFIVGFGPWRVAAVRRRGVVAAYVLGFVVLVLLVAPHAGSLLVPVVVYGASLTTMAVLASGLGRLGLLGGALFFVSDALIAVNTFTGHVPGANVLIMATYAAALALLVAGVLRAIPAGRRPG